MSAEGHAKHPIQISDYSSCATSKRAMHCQIRPTGKQRASCSAPEGPVEPALLWTQTTHTEVSHIIQGKCAHLPLRRRRHAQRRPGAT